MTHERLRREAALGWRPLVIRIRRHAVLDERLYDAIERNGLVFAKSPGREVVLEPDEYDVLAWGLSEACLKRMGVTG